MSEAPGEAVSASGRDDAERDLGGDVAVGALEQTLVTEKTERHY